MSATPAPASGRPFVRGRIRARCEEFGWVVALPDGRIDFYDRGVERVLDVPMDALVADTALLPHLLKELEFTPDQFHLDHPLIVSLELTRKCSLRCRTCYIDAGRAREDELTHGEVFELLDDLANAGVFCLQLTGGEPLEHAEILDVIDRAHELGLVISLITNGLHLTDEVISRLPRSEFAMGLSIDGILANEVIRGRRSRFDDLAEKALRLKRSGIQFNVILTLNRLNIDEAPDLIAWCRAHDIMLEVLETQPIGRAKRFHHLLTLTPADVDRDRVAYERKEELEDHFEAKVDPRCELFFSGFLQFGYWLNMLTGRCKGARSIAYIASDGEVYPCANCAAEGILGGGNIRTTPFSRLWAESFRAMRAITWADFASCAACELSRPPFYCSGRCPPLSSVRTGTYTGCGATPFTQAMIRSRTEVYLRMHRADEHEQVNPSRVVHVA